MILGFQVNLFSAHLYIFLGSPKFSCVIMSAYLLPIAFHVIVYSFYQDAAANIKLVIFCIKYNLEVFIIE